MKLLTGRVAVITGAGRGIGKAVTQLLAAAGADTVGVSRTADQVYPLAASLVEQGHRAVGLALDIGSEKAWKQIAAKVHDEFGRWDILINGAGIDGGIGDLHTIDSSTLENVLRTNVLGAALGCAAALHAMRSAKSGVIVNVSSGLARRIQPGLAIYSASKAALIQLSAVLAAEAAQDHVQVFALHPGIVDTEMVQKQKRDPSRSDQSIGVRLEAMNLLTPEESAKLFLLLATGREAALSGQLIQFDDPQVALRAKQVFDDVMLA